jgi:hypothetical protein
MRMTISGGGTSSQGAIGKVGRTFFFAIFLGMGLLFLAALGKFAFDASRPLFWQTAPATILSSEVLAHRSSYRAAVRYEYRWEGRSYTSNVLRRPVESHDRYAAAQAEVDSFPAGAKTTCRVNPARPSEAVLRTGNLWLALFAVIPLVFVVLGVGGIRATWRGVGPASAPRSGRLSGGGRAWLWLALFGGVFILLGAALTWGFSIPMWKRAFGSAKWMPTPCVVVSSRVGTHTGKDSTTYSVDVLYRYTFAGREYRSERYDAVGGSSSGYSGKARIVARYPAGAQTTCYVNPENPSEALLKPGADAGVLFGLVPIVFLAAGLLIVFFGGKKPAANRLPGAPAAGAQPAQGPLELKSSSSPAMRVLGAIFVTIFWNGIVSIFVSQAVESFREGSPEWFMALFLVPFVGVGLFLVGLTVHSLLALANPRIRLWLDPASPSPGGTVKVAWEITGAVQRIRRLWIYLEGREEATYRQRDSNSTEKATFARLPIVKIETSWMDMVRGEGTLLVPVGVPASFAAANNKIVWTLKARGEIARFPDVAEEFEITMKPQEGLLWTLPKSI